MSKGLAFKVIIRKGEQDTLINPLSFYRLGIETYHLLLPSLIHLLISKQYLSAPLTGSCRTVNLRQSSENMQMKKIHNTKQE